MVFGLQDSSVLDMEEEVENMRRRHRVRWKQHQQVKGSGFKVFFKRGISMVVLCNYEIFTVLKILLSKIVVADERCIQLQILR